MSKYNNLEKQVEKKYIEKDKSKRPKMKVTGKSVFHLKKLIEQKHAGTSKRKDSKKNR